jgi:hypothetical protein
MQRLTKEAKNAVMSDANLHRKMCLALGILPKSMPLTILRDTKKLTQFEVVNIIANHLKVEPNTLLEETKVKTISDKCNS